VVGFGRDAITRERDVVARDSEVTDPPAERFAAAAARSCVAGMRLAARSRLSSEPSRRFSAASMAFADPSERVAATATRFADGVMPLP
jgi:hypothetical protein